MNGMDWDLKVVLIKLVIAFVFGCILGLERSLKRKQASLKTAVVLTVTSCMVTVVSIEAAYSFTKETGIVMDPMRLTAQLISGISFIGAGIILTRNSDAVSGLTTAALMWASVGFGIGIGAGFYVEAGCALLLILIGVELLPYLIHRIGPGRLNEKQLRIHLDVKIGTDMTHILKEIKACDMKFNKIKVRDTGDQPHLECLLIVNERKYLTDVYEELKAIKGVSSVEVESL